MSILDEEIQLQLDVRQAAMHEAIREGDELRVAILRAEIEDLVDLARRHAAVRALHFTLPD